MVSISLEQAQETEFRLVVPTCLQSAICNLEFVVLVDLIIVVLNHKFLYQILMFFLLPLQIPKSKTKEKMLRTMNLLQRRSK